jgi:hypothetical protein
VPVPTLAQVRAWVQVSATTITDEQLQQVIDAELSNQARLCRVPDDGYPPDLAQALYRRVGRELAAKSIPTGLTDGEFGPARLPMFDAEIERLEGPRRVVVFG